jgi:hypothetical protein
MAGGGWLGMEGGRVTYGVAGGITGYEWGADVGVGTRSLAARLGYRQVSLDQSDVTPQVLRLAIGSNLPMGGSWRLCLAGHGGGSRVSGEAGDATVVAGGAGLGMTHDLILAGVRVVPFVEARGLAAQSTGTVLGIATDSDGLSLGVEGGAVAHVGRLHIRATAALDGFAAGLGTTPYPNSAIRLGLGYRF